jgi:hypothetical protein
MEERRRFWGLPAPDPETVAFYSEVQQFSGPIIGRLIDAPMLRQVRDGIREVNVTEFANGVRHSARVEIIGDQRKIELILGLLGKKVVKIEYYEGPGGVEYAGIDFVLGRRTLTGPEALEMARQTYPPTASGPSQG